MEVVNLKEHTDIADMIKRVDSKYRKHRAMVRKADTFTNNGTYWDGGSKNSHWLVTGSRVEAVPGPTAPPQFGGGKPNTIELPVGTYVVTLGTFCGKPATATVTIGTKQPGE